MVERMSRNSILGDLCSRLGGIAVEVARLRAALEVDGGRPTETAGSLADLEGKIAKGRDDVERLNDELGDLSWRMGELCSSTRWASWSR